ncbi:MAG: hypothetical protein ABS76_07315 [Pelagibacterium sp. SCN 64-44]|nr:MAG: hypothetical protein ABS76_07315 [Pelagibacterium sp. SCN 64-44]
MEALTDGSMLAAAGNALLMMLQFERLFFLFLGVVVGLAIGLLPGIGGLTGFALLVPFTYTMDPVAALGMLLGMSSVAHTSDTLPAVLLGVPGSSAAQATVMDGFVMAKKGEASRALSAAYTASLIGGLFGALVLAFTIPIVRPLVLAVGTPELLAITTLGIAMVASLSGNAPLRGVTIACFGILVSMIGVDMQTATMRWTGTVLYLWDGVPLMPIMLGIFALPELCDLAIQRTALAQNVRYKPTEGLWVGVRDAFRHYWLVIRCSTIGVLMGATPGVSGSVVDWMAYGHALRSEKGAKETFGKGDVRGVIAPESANNALNGGSLVPTLAFGIPASAGMAIFLGAMMVHGYVPGPEMLTKHLDVTYSMVWSIALANVFATILCIGLSLYLARIATLRYTLLLPAILVIVYVGAFQGSSSWGDLFVLLVFGLIGWAMKRLRWPRPPLILGLVLGDLIERYFGLSVRLYGMEWLLRPGVILFLGLSALILFRPLLSGLRQSGIKTLMPRGRPIFKLEDLFYVFLLVIAVAMVWAAQPWPAAARIGPTTVGVIMIIGCGLSLLNIAIARGRVAAGEEEGDTGLYMDIASESDGMSRSLTLRRAAQFFAWFLGFMASMAVIGLIPTVPLMVIAFMRIEGRESWKLCIGYAVVLTAFIYVVFDQLIHVAWPTTYLGHVLPELARFVPSM